MGHGLSWYNYIPGYNAMYAFFQNDFYGTVVFNNGILPKEKVFQTVHHIVAALIVFVVLAIMSLVAKYRLRNLEAVLVPSPKFSLLNFFEVFLETCLKFMRDILGPDYKRHVPIVATLGLFILFSGLLGLVPGFIPATDNLNTTVACGLIVFIYFNVQGMRVYGVKHFSHLANPVGEWWGWFLAPLFLPIEVIGILVRPFSLGIRLAGNMIGDHKVVLAFAGVFPFLLPLPFLVLSLLVTLIQTAVFCILTCVYISLHTQQADH